MPESIGISKFQTNFINASFQASTATQMGSAPFWDITQRIVIIPYLRFEKNYRSHLLVLNFLDLGDGTDSLSQNVGKELPLYAA